MSDNVERHESNHGQEDQPHSESIDPRPPFRVVAFVEGTNQPLILERRGKPTPEVVADQTQMESIPSEGVLLSKSVWRTHENGETEFVEREVYDAQGRIVMREVSGPLQSNVFEYPDSDAAVCAM